MDFGSGYIMTGRARPATCSPGRRADEDRPSARDAGQHGQIILVGTQW